MTAPSNTSGQQGMNKAARRMDPRIQGRRAVVRRQQGRRRLRLVIALAACVAVVGGGWALTKSSLLDVDRVQVVGATHSGTATVVQAAAISRGVPMTVVDESSAERRIEALPWVLTATVKSDWPSTVRVSVVERNPSALVPNVAGGWALVDRQARVLAWVSAPPPGLSVLQGLPPATEPGSQLGPESRGPLAVLEVLPASLRPKVAAVANDASGIEIRLSPSGTILLGDAGDVEAKLHAAEQVMAGVDMTGLAVLDVRLPNSPTVTRTNLDSGTPRR